MLQASGRVLEVSTFSGGSGDSAWSRVEATVLSGKSDVIRLAFRPERFDTLPAEGDYIEATVRPRAFVRRGGDASYSLDVQAWCPSMVGADAEQTV